MYFKGFEGKKFCLRVSPQNLKFLLVINYVILLSVVLVALITPPASSYEFSIYNAYPGYFWCLVISSIFLGQVCAVLSVLDDSTSKYRWLGFLAVFIANSLILFLPLLRGYFIYGGGDILTHIGYMKDIENYMSIGSDRYPILHILCFLLHDVAGFSFDTITIIIPPFFSIISILYWYVLGKEVFDDKLNILVLILIASLPMYGVVNSLFSPNHEAFLLLPLVLYCLIKSQNINDNKKLNLIIIILGILMVLFHPLIAVMVMLIYGLMYVLDRFSVAVSPARPHNGSIWLIILIMAIVFSFWSTYLYLLTNVLDPLISSIMGTDVVESEITSRLDLLGSVDVDSIYLMKIGFFMCGLDAIIGLLSLFCILYLLIVSIHKKYSISRVLLFSIACFMVLFILSVTIFLTINQFGYGRVYKIARIFSLLIISNTIVTIYQRFQNISNVRKTILCISLCALTIMLIVLSIFSVHLSPIIKQSNQQVVESDYCGMTTFFEKRDDSIQILEYGISQMRYYDAIYGFSTPRTNIRSDWGSGNLAPVDHFGYNASFSFGSNYNSRRYFLLTPQGEDFYENMYPEFPNKWRFTDSDFKMLKLDSSTIRIYSNNNLNIYMTYPLLL